MTTDVDVDRLAVDDDASAVDSACVVWSVHE